jgi:hypothetical protein
MIERALLGTGDGGGSEGGAGWVLVSTIGDEVELGVDVLAEMGFLLVEVTVSDVWNVLGFDDVELAEGMDDARDDFDAEDGQSVDDTGVGRELEATSLGRGHEPPPSPSMRASYSFHASSSASVTFFPFMTRMSWPSELASSGQTSAGRR